MAIKINNTTIINDNRGILDVNSNVGIANSILTSTGTSIEWKSVDSSVSTSPGIIYFLAATV